jgi:hypothetical protein
MTQWLHPCINYTEGYSLVMQNLAQNRLSAAWVPRLLPFTTRLRIILGFVVSWTFMTSPPEGTGIFLSEKFRGTVIF